LNYICKSESSQYYECGYSCDNGLFLNILDDRYFITDARYTIEAEESIKNAEVIETKTTYKCDKCGEIFAKLTRSRKKA